VPGLPLPASPFVIPSASEGPAFSAPALRSSVPRPRPPLLLPKRNSKINTLVEQTSRERVPPGHGEVWMQRSCMNGFAAFQFGEGLDGFPGLLFGEAEVVEALEVQPKLRAGAEEMSEAQGRIAGDGAGTVQDLRDAIRRHIHLARQFRRAQPERFEFLGQVFPRMDSDDHSQKIARVTRYVKRNGAFMG